MVNLSGLNKIATKRIGNIDKINSANKYFTKNGEVSAIPIEETPFNMRIKIGSTVTKINTILLFAKYLIKGFSSITETPFVSIIIFSSIVLLL